MMKPVQFAQVSYSDISHGHTTIKILSIIAPLSCNRLKCSAYGYVMQLIRFLLDIYMFCVKLFPTKTPHFYTQLP